MKTNRASTEPRINEFATLTPLLAFNPIGVQQTVTATLSGFPNICSNSHATTCTTDADCLRHVKRTAQDRGDVCSRSAKTTVRPKTRREG